MHVAETTQFSPQLPRKGLPHYHPDTVSVSHIHYPPKPTQHSYLVHDVPTTPRKQHVVLPRKEIRDWNTDVPQYSYAGQHMKSGTYANNIPEYFYKKPEVQSPTHTAYNYWSDQTNPNG